VFWSEDRLNPLKHNDNYVLPAWTLKTLHFTPLMCFVAWSSQQTVTISVRNVKYLNWWCRWTSWKKKKEPTWCTTYSQYISSTSTCFERIYHLEVQPYVHKCLLFWLDCYPTRTTDRRLKRIRSTNCCIHTVVPPDDGPWYARNMERLTKYKYTENKLCIKLGFLYTIISRCTVNRR
jgi:hypothetical protein